MRGAAASTLLHICTESEEYCEAFVEIGGLKGLVNQLDFPSDPSLHNPRMMPDLMLEAVWNLEDVIGPDGKLIERYAKLATEEGAVEKLERLRGIGNDEVKGAADKVLAALARVS